MLITELKWVMDNRKILDNEDYLHLQSHDIFNQYDIGELSQNGMKMLEVLGLISTIYEKYNNL